MSWPPAGSEPLSRLLVRTQAVVLVEEEVTGRPPPVPPPMRLQRIDPAGPVELSWTVGRTVGGAVVFAGLERVGVPADAGIENSNAGIENYRLLVDGDGVLRAERPAGYPFAVPPDPALWPVQVRVRLLPGPAYPYLRHIPAVRGRVVAQAAGGAVVSDAIVSATVVGAPAGAVSARGICDGAGRFTLGIPRYRPARAMRLVATAPDGTTGVPQALNPGDFRQPVELTVS